MYFELILIKIMFFSEIEIMFLISQMWISFMCFLYQGLKKILFKNCLPVFTIKLLEKKRKIEFSYLHTFLVLNIHLKFLRVKEQKKPRHI